MIFVYNQAIAMLISLKQEKGRTGPPDIPFSPLTWQPVYSFCHYQQGKPEAFATLSFTIIKGMGNWIYDLSSLKIISYIAVCMHEILLGKPYLWIEQQVCFT